MKDNPTLTLFVVRFKNNPKLLLFVANMDNEPIRQTNLPNMKIELHDHEFRAEFARFLNLIGANHWQRRAKVVRDQIKINRLLSAHLNNENSIAIGLAECEALVQKYSVIPNHIATERGLHAAMTFAAQTLSIIEESSSMHAKAWVGRIQGALKNPDNMRGLRLELTAATHFLRRGHSIVWAEQKGFGTFDILVEDIGVSGLEVECKSISCDKGRKIHQQEAIEFHSFLEPGLINYARGLQVGLGVVITVPERLPKMLSDRKQLAEFVVRQILTGQEHSLEDATSVHIKEFDAQSVKTQNQNGSLSFDRAGLDRATGTQNRNMMIIGGGEGLIAIVIQSKLEDEFIARTFETVADSAKRQVTKSRAAHYFVQFEGISASALRDIAELEQDSEQPPTHLRRTVSNLLDRESYKHLVGIGLLSRAETLTSNDGIVQSGGGGTVYNFPQRESKFWHTDFIGMFN